MARISGVDIPREKRLEISLTYIYGIGRTLAQKVCDETETNPDTRVRDLTDEEVTRLRSYIDANLKVEGDLRRDVTQDIKRKMEIGCYQGVRHRRGLPGPRAAHPHERTHAQGPEEDRRRKEEGTQALMPPTKKQGSKTATARRPRRRERKNIAYGVAHIKSSFNNTIVTIADQEGNVLAWASAGNVGFKGSRKSTPFAAQLAAEQAARRAMEHGVRKVDVLVQGPGLGPRDRRQVACRRRHRGSRHKGRHPNPPQRLPPEEAAPGVTAESGQNHMARYTGPVCRLCRRERTKLFLKGERCYSLKCPVSEAVTDRHSRAYPPGEHGRDRMRQGSEYLSQLREKQKARRIYGVLEKQFRNMYEEANRQPGITGENLLRMLELRLDNVAFRAAWGASRSQARQLVRHGHVLVNGKRVTIPSYRVRVEDVVSLKPGSRELYVVRRNLDTLDRQLPLWLDAGDGRNQVRVAVPARAPADRRVRARIADRRALLQVTAKS